MERMMRDILNVFKSALVGLVLIASAQAAGTTSAQFLNMGAGARPAGMGDAFTAVSDDANAAYWNPAGLPSIDGLDALFSHDADLLNTQYQYASVAMGKKNHHGFAASFQRMDYGTIEGYTSNDQQTEDFTAGSMCGSLSYGVQVTPGFNMGFTGKYISESIENYKGTAYAGDIGLLFSERQFNRFNFALSLKNIGSSIKFNEVDEKLPQSLTAGISGRFLEERLLLAADLSKPTDGDAMIHVGGEYDLGHVFFVRGGYKASSQTKLDVGGLTGVTGGFGLAWKGTTLDYAFVPFGELGATHRISIQFHISGIK